MQQSKFRLSHNIRLDFRYLLR